MTSAEFVRRGDTGMERVNRNPIWKVTDDSGTDHLVYACDELQAKDYVEVALGLIVIAVALDRAVDGESNG